MSRTMRIAILPLSVGLIFIIISFFTAQCYAELQVGFYDGKCGRFNVEDVVGAVVTANYLKDPRIVAALLRLQFHDCFVKGCDASILVDGESSEKTAAANAGVRGFDVIDTAKSILEAMCPQLVSCADIIAMATRDAVYLGGGRRYKYKVETGRRDGKESEAQNVDLPSPSISVSESISAFAQKGLNATDMVYLLGGHTVGETHCVFIQDRLYNFKNSGQPDPTMNSALAQKLRSSTCTTPLSSSGTNSVDLDQNPLSSLTVDNSYYKQLLQHRGILQIDQQLALDPQTSEAVKRAAAINDFEFNFKFGEAMIKLGRVQVLTGTQGDIRKSCRALN